MAQPTFIGTIALQITLCKIQDIKGALLYTVRCSAYGAVLHRTKLPFTPRSLSPETYSKEKDSFTAAI